jgi:hypothetical protein
VDGFGETVGDDPLYVKAFGPAPALCHVEHVANA